MRLKPEESAANIYGCGRLCAVDSVDAELSARAVREAWAVMPLRKVAYTGSLPTPRCLRVAPPNDMPVDKIVSSVVAFISHIEVGLYMFPTFRLFIPTIVAVGMNSQVIYL